MQWTLQMMGCPRPPSDATMPELRGSLRVLIQSLLDRSTLNEDQAESLRCWISFAPGDDLLEAFDSPSVALGEDPWPSFGLEGEDDGE